MARRFLGLLLTALLGGCLVPAEVGTDRPDAALADAARERDAGRSDAGAGPDGGVGPDAGPSSDAGCQRQCTGRECGDDGCGGSCGSCAPPTGCGPAGLCGILDPCLLATCGGTTPLCVEVAGSPQCHCTATSCGTGIACRDGICDSPCQPPCSGETPRCDAARRECMCTGTSCTGDRACVNNQCKPYCPQACSGETPVCDHWTRTCQCTETSCAEGWRCERGVCQKKPPCDVARKTGCAEGEACYWSKGEGFRCLPAGTTPVGSPCSETSRCVPGAECVGSYPVCRRYCDRATGLGCGSDEECDSLAFPYDEHVGVCDACHLCWGTVTCCPPGTYCSLAGCVWGAVVCSPFSSQPCPPKQGCYADYYGAFSCREAGTLPAGAACSKGDECLPGFGCFGQRCRQWCSGACPVGESCLRATVDYGVCVSCPKERVCGGACCLAGQTCQGGACVGGAACSPTTDSCPSGLSCYFDSLTLAYLCLAPGATPLGGRCQFDWECGAGLGCMGPRRDVCVPYCNPAASQCGTGKVCEELGDGNGWCG